MEIGLVLAIAIVLVVVFGVIIWTTGNNKIKAELKKLEDRKAEILNKAKKQAGDIRLKAKNEGKRIVQEEKKKLEDDFRDRKREISAQEKDVARKEVRLDELMAKREVEFKKLKDKDHELNVKKDKIEKEHQAIRSERLNLADKLEHVAGMTKDQAKEQLVETMTEEARVDAAKAILRIEEETKEEAEKRAKRVVGIAIDRFSGEYVAERTISSVELPSDEIKGRLIGREGRNIRAFEQICGVDLIIDDTPGIVVISSFNVVRKQIAKMTIERLIADGRIHPAKIEEFYERSRKELESRLRELGEKAQLEIGVHGIHPEILKLIGALNFRTSYTQNQYQHAIEAAMICGSMAAELGMNVKQARRAGLLHDIGKVLDASAEGSHAVIGADFAKKYGEAPDIVHAIRSHHDDEKPETVLAHLVSAADALSGARPGARKALKESYVSRLEDIENIVNSFEGITKSYAISAGREIRVLVENDKIDDENTVLLSRNIAKKIEDEMSYPGTIKVTVVRETRSVGVAK